MAIAVDVSVDLPAAPEGDAFASPPDASVFAERLTPIPERIREALIFVIRQADRANIRLTQYEILKSLFFADREHLRTYGRPITFDQYEALPDGPVPSLTYDALKGSLHAMRFLGLDEALWRCEPAGGKAYHYFDVARDADDDVLSESDMEELEKAVTMVHSMTFSQIWDLSHEDPAYQSAWNRRGNARAAMMRYDELLGKDALERLGDVFAAAWDR